MNVINVLTNFWPAKAEFFQLLGNTYENEKEYFIGCKAIQGFPEASLLAFVSPSYYYNKTADISLDKVKRNVTLDNVEWFSFTANLLYQNFFIRCVAIQKSDDPAVFDVSFWLYHKGRKVRKT